MMQIFRIRDQQGSFSKKKKKTRQSSRYAGTKCGSKNNSTINTMTPLNKLK